MWQSILTILLLAVSCMVSKSRSSAWLAVAYSVIAAFSYSWFYNILPAFYVQMSYVVIMSLFIPLTTPNFWVALGMGIYAIFNLIVALDYLFYPKIDTILSIYYVHLHVLVDTILIYLSSKRVGNNGNGDAVVNHFIVCVGCISGSINRLQRLEKAQ